MHMHLCVRTCLCILVGHGGSGRQRIMGLMPGEIMTLSNRILGNGTIVALEKMMSSSRFGCHLEPLVSWRVAALT